MHQVSARQGRKANVAAGFTLIEALVALAILSTLVAIGIPQMNEWVQANRAAAATQFYAEGFTLARAHAVTHNSASRLVLTENPANGQMDWQVDICFPTVSVPCNAESGAWSTTSTAAARLEVGVAARRQPARHLDAGPDPQPVRRHRRLLYFARLGRYQFHAAPDPHRAGPGSRP